ncbi:MAG: HAMP domain-containing sensor histidine kinase [Eubacteriales bacterium]
MNKRKHRLRTQLIFWSVGILSFFMISQMLFLNFFAPNYTLKQKEEQISSLLEHVKENYSDDPMQIYALVERAQSVNNLRIMIYSDKQLIYHSSSVGQAPDKSNFNVLTKHNITDFLQSHSFLEQNPQISLFPLDEFPLSSELSNFLFFNEVENNVIGVEESFTHKGQNRTIAIWCSTIAIDDTVELFHKVNFGVSLGVILLAVLTVVLFSQRFTRPVVEMEQVARAVADLDFSNHADENVRTRELSSLAVSINLMSDNLEEMIRQLNQDNRTLSNKVENQEKLEQMRRQFVANISHEMKTPLSMLMMYSENLKLDLPNMDKNFYYDTIFEEAAGLNAMVEQLLDTSAVENGLSQMNLQPMNFSQFVSAILEKITPLADKTTFSQTIEPEIWVKGDGKYLEQALRNYLTNAFSHCPEGGEIQVSLSQTPEQKAKFQVTNSGTPIPKEDIPFLWDSFYRGDKSRTQIGEKRVGLGLYIVKTCISSHFGEVFVENLPQAVAFSFEIPILQTENDPPK